MAYSVKWVVELLRRRGLDIAFVLILGIVVYRQIPVFLIHSKMQSEPAPTFSVQLLSGQSISRQSGEKKVLVFWATWCNPCSLELARVNRLVQSGVLRPDRVLAISVGEEKEVVVRHVSERRYQFQIALDPEARAANLFQVRGTPTFVFIDANGQIDWVSSGVSPSLEFRLSSFLGK